MRILIFLKFQINEYLLNIQLGGAFLKLLANSIPGGRDHTLLSNIRPGRDLSPPRGLQVTPWDMTKRQPRKCLLFV